MVLDAVHMQTCRLAAWHRDEFTPMAPQAPQAAHGIYCEWSLTVSHKHELYLELERGTTLVKIRCIIQMVLLFGFREVIQSTGSIRGF